MANFLKSMGNLASRKSNSFENSLYRFPSLKIDKIASDLRLKQRGEEDGRLNFPTEDSLSLTAVERDAVENIRNLRSAALNNFEAELESYNTRIGSVKDEKEKIELLVGKAEHEIVSISNNWENRLENQRVRVREHQDKLKKFQKKNNIEGPPRESKNIVLTIGLIAILGLIETVMNGYFFAEANPMGYLGGIILAAIIAFINISFSSIFGHFSRQINIKSMVPKLWGVVLIICFIIFASILNLSIAHFRDALEVQPWEDALVSSLISLKNAPFELRSINSWLVIGFGAAVSFTSFWKTFSFSDPYPGYSRLWHENEECIDNYTDEFNEAHDELDAHFEKSSKNLRDEIFRRRDNIKSAEDALTARISLVRNLNIFLESCSEGVNKLLRIYRDANIKARSQRAPKHFEELFYFEDYKIEELKNMQIRIPEVAERELIKAEEAVQKGVAKLLKSRKEALSAFPTIRQIKYEEA
ncbi:hypothetical protein ELY33_00935 [Vreelandella andesensis]|uniref:Uncharacterized protein n=1 Tax=Vreelandella andesensis TaxID=447567 RepID=A0A433KYE0_9GAMM|nr:hypothetical protein [Halomonas andesensis]RUR34775.1 hypothetical protein ELY33_00935 [Halomonas andesensis]